MGQFRSPVPILRAAAIMVWLASVIALMLWTGLARATSPDNGWPVDLQGRAPELTVNGPTGFYLWLDDAGFHLLTTSEDDEEHVFSAVLVTDGHLVDIAGEHIEVGDEVRVREDEHVLRVFFFGQGDVDGVHFGVDDGTYQQLTLGLDGQLADPDRIFLGSRGRHPTGNPFTVYRDP